MEEKLLSVIIPSYNRADKIERSVRSVLNQDYKNLEVIVVDDGSDDNTVDIIKEVADPRLRYIYQENSGACAARNNGIRHARGEYIAFHDSDDIWHQDKLEKQMPILLNNQADIVFCKLALLSENGKSDGIARPTYIKGGLLDPITTVFGISTQTLVMKADVAKRYLFDEKMPRWQDFEFMLRATQDNRLYCVDEPLVDYIIGEDSISRNSRKLVYAARRVITKHPWLNTKYPYMSEQVANALFGDALHLHNQELQEILDVIKKYKLSSKLQIKILIFKLGLWNVARKMKHLLLK